MYEEDLRQITGVCDKLQRDSNAQAVLCIDMNGQEIASAGAVEALDVTSLCSLAAGNVAATTGIAQLVNEKEFPGQFYEGKQTNVHSSVIGSRIIVLVLFDGRSSLGLVRLRVRKAANQLLGVLAEVDQKSEQNPSSGMLADITDEDIDNLFND